MHQLLLDIDFPPPQSFGNFLTGHNAEVIHSLKIGLAGSSDHRFIYLWGEVGCGKSHLLAACRHSNPEVHLVDDVHLFDADAQATLFNTYNRLQQEGGMLVVAGDNAPRHMQLRDDLATRLAWGLTYQIRALSDTQKFLALQQYAKERGMLLPDGVLRYCFTHLPRDLGFLRANLDALDRLSRSTQQPITLPLLKKLLEHHTNRDLCKTRRTG